VPSARPFGVYVHVPFCTTRCGYCDFNTYTASEAGQAGYVDAVLRELELGAGSLNGSRPTAADTVFFGGGTPTLLAPTELGRILAGIRDAFGMAPGAEVTVEANPETVDPAAFTGLLEAGVTRVSLGMQSAAPHVLAVLDRQHTPGRAVEAAREAHEAGFEHVSLDLIYGAPGETAEDWRGTLETALSAEPDHLSAYGLIVEPGTRLAAQVRRGDIRAPDDDAMADRYLAADAALSAAGLAWYEVSNWASSDDAQCRHNLGYWGSGDWWGAGPGAHGHLHGMRWWNVLHPRAYAKRLGEGELPEAGREVLDEDTQRVERVMLAVRLAEGVALDQLHPAGRAAADRFAAEGLLELRDGRAVLTLRGRLLADAVIRDLVD
jgi:oxygen-independent coproporphyrinogen-3 oxidase